MLGKFLCTGAPPLLLLLEPSHPMKKTGPAPWIWSHMVWSMSIAPANQQTHSETTINTCRQPVS